MTAKPATNRRPLTAPEPAAILEEVALELGVSTVRVRQIERKALNKLRRALTKRGFTRDDIIF